MEKELVKNYVRGKWESQSCGVEKLSVYCKASELGSAKRMTVEFVAYRALKCFFSANIGSSPSDKYEFHIESYIDAEQQLRSNSIIVMNGGFFDSPLISNDGLPGYKRKQPIGYTKPINAVFNFAEQSQYYCHNVDGKYEQYYGLVHKSIGDDSFKILSYTNIPNPVENFLNQQSTYVSGAPILITNNFITFSQQTMNESIFKWNDINKKNAPGFLHHADQPNPRSLYGLNQKYNYFITIKGRSGSTIGLNLAECAILMHGLGCTDAINLDGGGSSNVTYSNRTKTKQVFGGNRAVPDVLSLTRKADYPEDFIILRDSVARCFNGYITNSFSLFFINHHHNDRAKKVKKAILKSHTALQIHAILLSQLSLFDKNIKFDYNYDDMEILADKYSLTVKNKRHTSYNNSGYVRALYAAYNEGKNLSPLLFTLDL